MISSRDVEFFEESMRSTTCENSKQSVVYVPIHSVYENENINNEITEVKAPTDTIKTQVLEQASNNNNNQQVESLFGNDVSMVEVGEIKPTDEDGVEVDLRRSSRPRRRPRNLDDYVVNSVVPEQTEPETYLQAIQGSESASWLEAMKSEYNSIIDNKTWELCDLPPDKNVISTKWVFKKKVDNEGKIKYKARIVARGFTQRPGIDYQDTYSPVVRFTTLRILFAYAARHDLNIYHWDVDSAFLQGEVDEELYLEQPEGFL